MRVLSPLLALLTVVAGCAVEPEASSVRMAYPHELVTMDPHAHVDSVTIAIQSAIYESLVFMEPGLPVRARLADRWTTPDDHTWHLHIREGVRFHDGTRLTPADVVASIERARASTVVGHQLDEIAGVRVLPDDDRVIEIVTAAPAPLLLTRLESVPVVPLNFDPQVPVGTGPYQWRIGSIQGPVLLQRWDGYWGEPPAYSEVSIQFVPYQEDLAVLIHHQKLDVVASVSVSYVKDHPQAEHWRVVSSPEVAVTYLGLNASVRRLSDLRVRRAIDLAVDRSELVEDIFPVDSVEPAYSMVPPEVFGYSPDHRRTEVDADRAREMLATTGASSARQPLRMAYFDRDALVAEHLLRVFEAIGLEVEGEQVPYEVFYNRIQEAASDLFLFMWTYRIPDASQFLDTFVRTRDPERGLGTFNGAALAVPEIDALIESAMIEPNSALRLQKLQNAISLVVDQHVYLPLYKPSNLSLVRDEVNVASAGSPMIRPQDLRPRR